MIRRTSKSYLRLLIVIYTLLRLNAGTKRNWLDCLLSINKKSRKLRMPEVC
uniref:Uncharacterized protein n=1 Tax=Helianthus annuus TaxID=4232 RepID=A0A251TUF8_HELAN